MQIVINGGGKICEVLANTLYKNGHQVSVIEINKAKIEQLAHRVPQQVLLIHGDGCDSDRQRDAGIEEADIFVSTTGADDVNMVSCEIASLVFGVPRAIARVSNPKNNRIFRSLGIEVVSSTTVISRLIELEVTEGAVHALLSMTHGDLLIIEITLAAKVKSKTPKGKKVADIAKLLPEESLLVAVGDGHSMSIVKGDTILHPGDSLIVVGKQGTEDEIREALNKLW
ncbi:MAG: TrkA family potassium uptake protein [Coriobacteriia bacterium]|nr:TrkA family potassium uptake protein [Coriobacteriia bacterium]MCL2750495.1 TrkA family potassium uptake protein [Coriobacteriia bacterium]